MSCKISKGEDSREMGEVERSGAKGLEKRSKVEDTLQRSERKDLLREGGAGCHIALSSVLKEFTEILRGKCKYTISWLTLY